MDCHVAVLGGSHRNNLPGLLIEGDAWVFFYRFTLSGMALRSRLRLGARPAPKARGLVYDFTGFSQGFLTTLVEIRLVAGEIDSGLGSQCRQSGHEIHRFESHLRGAIAVGRRQGVDHFAGGAE